jgi:hypothetical protein
MAKPTGGKNGAPKKKTYLDKPLLDELNELEYSGHKNDIWYDIRNYFKDASPELIAIIENRIQETADLDVYEVRSIIDDMISDVSKANNISSQKNIIEDVKIKLSDLRYPNVLKHEKSNMISRTIGHLNKMLTQEKLLIKNDMDYLYWLPNKISPGEIKFILNHIDFLINEALNPTPKRRARLHKPLQEWDKFEEVEWGDSGVMLVKQAISAEDFEHILYEVAFNLMSTEGIPNSVIDGLIYTTPPEKRKPTDKIYDPSQSVNDRRSFITKVFQNKLKDYYKSLFASEDEYIELKKKADENKKLKHNISIKPEPLKKFSPEELVEYNKEYKKQKGKAA